MQRDISSRRTALAWVLAIAISSSVFIGRSAVTADGAEVISETLGFLISGRFEYPARMWQTRERTDTPILTSHSKFGLPSSILPVPFLGPGWFLRGRIGALWVDRFAALTWLAGALFAAGATGKLIRTVKPGSSPYWIPAVLAGTFLLPYAAESFVEPWCAGFLGLGAALLLDESRPLSPSVALGSALAWSAAALLKPILWLLAPILLLAFALRLQKEPGSRASMLAVPAVTFTLAVALQLLMNSVRMGSPFEFGYGADTLAFSTPLLKGLAGLLLEPGKGLILYAPLAVAGMFALARAPRLEQVLLGGASALLILTMAQWGWWAGGLAWGPRFLLPVLPLMFAPAVRLPRLLVCGALGMGFLTNLPGALVASGGWVGYVEALQPPANKTWNPYGTERITQEWYLSPIYGHYWLLARGTGFELPAPWLRDGAVERMRPPSLPETLSPMALRHLAGYPPVSPLIPQLLLRLAAEYEARGQIERAAAYRIEAVRFAPR